MKKFLIICISILLLIPLGIKGSLYFTELKEYFHENYDWTPDTDKRYITAILVGDPSPNSISFIPERDLAERDPSISYDTAPITDKTVILNSAGEEIDISQLSDGQRVQLYVRPIPMYIYVEHVTWDIVRYEKCYEIKLLE